MTANETGTAALRLRVTKTWCEMVNGKPAYFLQFAPVYRGEQVTRFPIEGDFAKLKVGDELEVKPAKVT